MTYKRQNNLRAQRIVIVGNGISGNSAATAIRRFDQDVNITLISNEKVPLYSPCAFYKYLSGEMEKQKLYLKNWNDYSRERIETLLGQNVSDVDIKSRKVYVGERGIDFGKLILATGSKSILPPIKGVDKIGVFPLKTIDDAERIFNCKANKVVVIGSGPIGIEAAIAFRKRGLKVTVAETLSRILPRLFDDKPSGYLRRIVEEHGIEVLTNERVIEITGMNSVSAIKTNKRELECDAVIISVGVNPDTSLATQLEINISSSGGIKTDEYMMTNVDDVYACGDCIESKDMITGESTLSLLWYNAKRQGWISGCNCLGRRVKYAGSFNATLIEIFGIFALSMGSIGTSWETRTNCEIIEKSNSSTYRRLIIKGNRIVGAQLINTTEHAGLLASVMWRKDNFLRELYETILDDKLISIRPWRYWMRTYKS